MKPARFTLIWFAEHAVAGLVMVAMWAVLLGIAAAAVIGVVAALKNGQIEAIWLTPVALLFAGIGWLAAAPYYFWLTVLIIMWMDFRLGRAENVLWEIQKSMHRLRRPRRPTKKERDEYWYKRGVTAEETPRDDL
ncbi:MAG: hypothetical protein HYU51_16850 [Candidatus Rokubacteria bacterium]|nr:hypothetical protein [Candidatus Rokubacteria bacterium]